VKPLQVCVYVEGGGDTRSGDLATDCKIAFSALLERATGRKLKIIPCGGRGQAYRAFAIAVAQCKYDLAILLVDSEEVPRAESAWAHLQRRDEWAPLDAPAHLMVVCMEAWLLADHGALREHFGNDFDEDKIPKWPKLWEVNKQAIYGALENATKGRDRKKGGPYGKGRDSFKILKLVDPKKLEACPHANALFEDLRHRLAEMDAMAGSSR
jgi:Domain of unknown function (DUF4276)